jgi:hypothetical protein
MQVLKWWALEIRAENLGIKTSKIQCVTFHKVTNYSVCHLLRKKESMRKFPAPMCALHMFRTKYKLGGDGILK